MRSLSRGMKLQLHPAQARVSALPALVLSGAIALLAGCASGPESHVISAPPPAPVATTVAGTTTTTTTSAPVVYQQAGVNGAPGSTVIVTQAPPAPQTVAIARPERPSSNHVWLEGYWTWRNSRYEWMPAHWAQPPSSSAVWVAPRYEPEGNSYRFYEGYWKY